jgi:hypothetical protein
MQDPRFIEKTACPQGLELCCGHNTEYNDPYVFVIILVHSPLR